MNGQHKQEYEDQKKVIQNLNAAHSVKKEYLQELHNLWLDFHSQFLN